MSSSASNQMFTLQDVPGKGKGLVAITEISKGTRILSEEPIIVIPENTLNTEQLHKSICQQVATLREQQQRAFLSMTNIHPYKNDAERYAGIFATNSLPADEDNGAIFLQACRINHACDNNAQKSWNEKIKRHTVHALEDIEKGEEITITYLSPLKNRTTRQKVLQERFGFTCLCHLCSLPAEQNLESDRRLEEIHRLDGVINQLGAEGIMVSPLRTLGYFDQQVRLYKEQGREDVGFAHALVNAAQLAIATSDLARGRIFMERAASVWKTTLGGDSTEAIKHKALAQNPSKYELYRVSTKWVTKVDDAPRGLKPSDFEDWLWRREKPKQPGQSADFRTQCANCGSDATTRCAGCMDAPEYQSGDSDGVVYCNRDCQKRHWSDHKAHCRALGERRKLLRAATILKAALLTYREVVYDVDLTKIEFQDGVLCLHQKQRSLTARSKRGLFPAHLTTNTEHKEAALAKDQCATAMILLGRLTRKLLKGIASTIEVLDLHIGKPRMPTKLVPGPDSSDCLHTVLKVRRLFANEAWILDSAGCQYGFREVLVPFEKYLSDKSGPTLNEPTTYDTSETKDIEYFAALSFMNRTQAQREDDKLEREARLHFAVFVHTQVNQDILNGSAAGFKDKLGRFVQELRLHMLSLGN